MARAADAKGSTPTQEQLLDAVLTASRGLIAIAARSLAASEADVTLSQYRALVVLTYRGPQRTVDLAAELDVNSSTSTRMVDRLVRHGLVRRDVDPEDRRANRVEITASGRAVVEAVMSRRRSVFAKILRTMDPEMQRCLHDGLQALNHAAGEAPEQPWTLGWGT